METPYAFLKNIDIHLIRHGESESNKLRSSFISRGELITDDMKIEDSKIPLSQKGVAQALELGNTLSEYLKLKTIPKDKVLVLSSPYDRSVQTFLESNKILTLETSSSNYFELNALREQSYGAFHMISKEIKREIYGQIYDECKRTTVEFYQPQFLGESPAEVSDRLMNVLYFIKEQVELNDIKTIFIYSHRNVNKCLLMNIFNLPAKEYTNLGNISNASNIYIHNGFLNN